MSIHILKFKSYVTQVHFKFSYFQKIILYFYVIRTPVETGRKLNVRKTLLLIRLRHQGRLQLQRKRLTKSAFEFPQNVRIDGKHGVLYIALCQKKKRYGKTKILWVCKNIDLIIFYN